MSSGQMNTPPPQQDHERAIHQYLQPSTPHWLNMGYGNGRLLLVEISGRSQGQVTNIPALKHGWRSRLVLWRVLRKVPEGSQERIYHEQLAGQLGGGEVPTVHQKQRAGKMSALQLPVVIWSERERETQHHLRHGDSQTVRQ